MSRTTPTAGPVARPTRRQLLRFLAAATLGIAASPALAACGTGAGGAGDGKQQTAFSSEVVAQTVEVAAAPDGTLRWDRQEYRAQAGDVTFVVRNPSPVAHRFGVEGNGVNAHSPDLLSKKTGSYTLRGLKAGEYTIVCNYPGHREAGMVAKLVVT